MCLWRLVRKLNRVDVVPAVRREVVFENWFAHHERDLAARHAWFEAIDHFLRDHVALLNHDLVDAGHLERAGSDVRQRENRDETPDETDEYANRHDDDAEARKRASIHSSPAAVKPVSVTFDVRRLTGCTGRDQLLGILERLVGDVGTAQHAR
jgi:hypothetical protein